MYYIALLLTLLTNVCNPQYPSGSSAVSVITSSPINYSLQDGRMVVQNLKDTLSMFFIGEYFVGRLRPSVNFNRQQNIRGTEPYFIRKKNEKSGLLFRSTDDRSGGERFNADTFMMSNGLKYEEGDFPAVPDEYKNNEVVEDKLTSSVIEKFIPIGHPSETLPDTIFYYLKKIPELKYSFSRILETLKGIKLYKVRFFFKEGYSEEKKMLLPDHEIVFELLSISPNLTVKENALLEHFKKVNW